MFIFEGNEIETDSEGYLKDTTQWSEAMAEVIAAQEGITLAVEHWEVCLLYTSTPGAKCSPCSTTP